MKKMLKILLAFVLLIVLLVLVLGIRTMTYPFAKNDNKAAASALSEVSELSVRRFSDGLKIPTVSFDNYEEIDFKAFDNFRAYLEEAYPEIYAKTEHYTVNTHSMVFIWKGKNPQLAPLLFLSHYDVVPPGDFSLEDNLGYQQITFDLDETAAPAATEIAEKWEYAPFSGAVAKGRIYGRGALDMKNMLFSILEATDKLIKSGFVPERDIYIAFGHDEEVGGPNGSSKIAEDFASKGLRFDAVYDEGGIIAGKGSIEGINNDMALIGFAEKGYASYRVKVKGLGGHSSMPPLHSAMGKAAIIMQRLEDKQMKQELILPIENFLKNAGGSMSFTSRIAIANQWLFKSMLLNSLQNTPATNALTRTTTALTMMKGSDANNILPPVAEFVVNFRILPGNSSADVLSHLQNACDGFEVEIEAVRKPQEPSNVSPDNVRAYQVIQETVAKIYPEAIISPYITIGGTDAIKYEALCDNVYRFSPALLNEPEQRSIHNQNEYISIENFGRMILYFESIMKNYDVK